MDDKNSQVIVDMNITLMQLSVKWIAIIGAVFLGLLYVFWLGWSMSYDNTVIETLYSHLRAAVGIPGSAISAFVIVTVLEQVSGPIHIEVKGFILKGAAGPVVLWIGCFFSLVAGISMLW
jgi:uncharacterized membrane protein